MNPLAATMLPHLPGAQAVALLLDTLLKSFVVLALAGGVAALWRRASAATRHLIWFLALTCLPLLPWLNALQPSWQRPLWTVSAGFDSGNQLSLALELAPGGALDSSTVSDGPAISAGVRHTPARSRLLAARFNAGWMRFGLAAWLGVAALMAGSAAANSLRLRRISRRARPLSDSEWTRLLQDAAATLRCHRRVTLLQSSEDMMPMTWGWLRAVVLLPPQAAQWSTERRRVVLLHELAHLKRADCLTQRIAQFVCALFWFNPLVWLAARQMRVERELACDDLVLTGGCKASDYAGHLVEIAARFRAIPFAAAIAMARPSHLAGRIAALVDGSRNRTQRSAAAIAILAMIGGMAVCLGGSGLNPAGGAADHRLRQQQLERLETFAAAKAAQSRLLAQAAGEAIPADYESLFRAATNGDWQTVTNLYAGFLKRHPQYGRPHQRVDASLRTAGWGPVLEICLAYDLVVQGNPRYTQLMADGIINSIPRGSLYFGGTDPGRGLPTAFCPSQINADPFYTLTQNALADGTYLDYLQKTYGAQNALLAPLADACQADAQIQALSAEILELEQKLAGLDPDGPDWQSANGSLGYLINRQDEKVRSHLAALQSGQPLPTAASANQSRPAPLYIPTPADSQKCFQEYSEDAVRRLASGQLKPGEDVQSSDGRVQVSGQVAVMEINARLARIIFDQNPGRECYLEESFALDWMYPRLEPHGLIFKVNRQPLAELSAATLRRDRDYWQPLVNQMIGAWLNEDTPLAQVIAFAEKTFVRHDLAGFSGDPGFVQNDYAGRMFSKLRGSIAGLYAWRADHAETAAERQRLAREADLAFRQALALRPDSPEAANRYAAFLTGQQRAADAKRVSDLAAEFTAPGATPAAPAPAPRPVFQARLVLDAPAADAVQMTNENPLSSGSDARSREVLFVQKTVLLDQTAVASATVSTNRMGYRQIEVVFTEAGGKRFGDLTREHLHQRLAIIIDGRLLSAPKIQSPITGGAAVITGTFSDPEARDLADKLNQAAGR